ncbi:hypothetical protein TNCV_2168351 [Trichonephila clavipes]|nr:hypothetical protein TNCV_2168351 [Trichonephila clavipes]
MRHSGVTTSPKSARTLTSTFPTLVVSAENRRFSPPLCGTEGRLVVWGTSQQRHRGQDHESVTSTVESEGLGSNPGEDMDVCKCIVPFRHAGTLNSRRASSLLVWLEEGVERWETPEHPRCPPSKLGRKRAKSYCHLYSAQSYG